MGKNTAIVTAVAFSISLAASFPTPAQAGGWGRGPSWSQARKIAKQAVTDIGNGAQVAVKTTGTILCAAGGAAVGTAVSGNPAVAIVGAGAAAQACSH